MLGGDAAVGVVFLGCHIHSYYVSGRPITYHAAAVAGSRSAAQSAAQPSSKVGQAGYLLTVAHEAESHPPDDAQLLTWAFYDNPIAIGVTDLDGRLLCTNQAMPRAAGSSEAELRGHNVTEFLAGPGFSEITRQVLRVAEIGVPETVEAYVRSPGSLRRMPGPSTPSRSPTKTTRRLQWPPAFTTTRSSTVRGSAWP
ncbi:PAS domain-containing protein [Streptomyces xylophagus]|uniref:PAS domain-containing protein n=1 Tax=Streptomyces xylophagus TaxID=285514 RepID=UPI00131B4D3B